MLKKSGASLATGLTACLLFAGTAVAAALPAGSTGLTATLEAERSFAGPSEDVVVRITYTNDSAADLYLLRWQTALQGVEANLFDVRLDGRPVAYTGRLYKRAQPTVSDYLRIPAGGSLSADVDLSQVYDLSRTGEVAIGYRVLLQYALRAESQSQVSDFAKLKILESNRIFVGMERDHHPGDAIEKLVQIDDLIDKKAPARVPPPRYVGCTNKRKTQLATARSNAQKLVLKSRDYLSALPEEARPSDAEYETWFGRYGPSNYQSVTNDYVNLNSAFLTKTFTFYCDCNESNYAYVYSDQPYKVHLCNHFWTAPTLGTDSKAGTLVHEASHFTVVAATGDYAYGQEACRALAQENPFAAIHNADTHEYFAEER
jgi:peptidyl-Lys metalloendopeptidase